MNFVDYVCKFQDHDAFFLALKEQLLKGFFLCLWPLSAAQYFYKLSFFFQFPGPYIFYLIQDLVNWNFYKSQVNRNFFQQFS